MTDATSGCRSGVVLLPDLAGHAARLGQALASAALIALPALAAAATPDAGSLLREELRRDQPPAPVMPPRPEAAAAEKPVVDDGPRITVSSFRIIGLSAIPESEAQSFLAPYRGRALSLEGLHQLAERFEKWLRGRGLFVARAYVPPQDIRDGVVEIRVLEGRVEGIDIKRKEGSRLAEERLLETVSGALPPGAALEQERLERGLLLLNDFPATSARAVLTPGQAMGGSRIMIEAAQGPVVAGSIEADNTGNRFSGEYRLSAALSLNDPYGFGDQWSLRASETRGSHFLRAAYTAPLGSNGWRLGLSLIESGYQLCCDAAVAALGSNGEASAQSATLSYALRRSRLANHSLALTAANRQFVNRSVGATTSDKRSRSVSLAASGNLTEIAGPTGLGSYAGYSLQWTGGQLDLGGWKADQTADALTARAGGGYQKWAAQASYLMRMSAEAAAYAGLSAQWAGKNLDSSEKFILGGVQGVRAYPTSEATGDEGWMLNLEWRQELRPDLRAVAFFDHGVIKLHRLPWTNWNAATPTLPNRYALSGAGASLVWAAMPNAQLAVTLASRLDRNPGRDATGRDADNRPPRVQLWLQGSMAF